MSSERRKKLASLSFTEKEKLRQRSLALAEARKKLKEKAVAENSSETRGQYRWPEILKVSTSAKFFQIEIAVSFDEGRPWWPARH